MGHFGRVEVRAPVVSELAELDVETLRVHPDDDVAEAAPGV
jgi:hypothetical protein